MIIKILTLSQQHKNKVPGPGLKIAKERVLRVGCYTLTQRFIVLRGKNKIAFSLLTNKSAVPI